MKWITVIAVVLVVVVITVLPTYEVKRVGEVIASSMTGNVTVETDYGPVWIDGKGAASFIYYPDDKTWREYFDFLPVGKYLIIERRNAVLGILISIKAEKTE